MLIRFLKENFVLKFMSLVASIALWLYVAADRNNNVLVSKTLNAEIVRIGTAPTDLVVRLHTEPLPVELTGIKSELDNLAEGDIKAEVDLRNVRSGQTQIRVSRYKLPATSPSVEAKGRMYVTAEVNPRSKRNLPISPIVNSNLVDGKKYGTPTVTPQFSTISGSQDDIKRIVKLVVFLEPKGQGISGELPVHAVDKDDVDVSGIEVLPSTVHVELAMPVSPGSRVVPVNVPHKVQTAPGFILSEIIIDPPQVTIMGNGETVSQISNLSTDNIEIQNATSDQVREVTLRVPQGISINGISPLIKVTFKVKQLAR